MANGNIAQIVDDTYNAISDELKWAYPEPVWPAKRIELIRYGLRIYEINRENGMAEKTNLDETSKAIYGALIADYKIMQSINVCNVLRR